MSMTTNRAMKVILLDIFTMNCIDSAKFSENAEILRQLVNSAGQFIIPWPAQNCGPY